MVKTGEIDKHDTTKNNQWRIIKSSDCKRNSVGFDTHRSRIDRSSIVSRRLSIVTQFGIDVSHEQSSMSDVFKHKAMRNVTLNLLVNWMVNVLLYYGLSLSAGNLPGSIFVNNAVLNILEIPAILLTPYLLETKALGRCGTLAWFMMAGGALCLLSTMFLILQNWYLGSNCNCQTLSLI